MTFHLWIVSTKIIIIIIFEFPLLNRFCSLVRKLFKFSLHKRKFIPETIGNILHFTNSKANSFLGNYSCKYRICFVKLNIGNYSTVYSSFLWATKVFICYCFRSINIKYRYIEWNKFKKEYVVSAKTIWGNTVFLLSNWTFSPIHSSFLWSIKLKSRK